MPSSTRAPIASCPTECPHIDGLEQVVGELRSDVGELKGQMSLLISGRKAALGGFLAIMVLQTCAICALAGAQLYFKGAGVEAHSGTPTHTDITAPMAEPSPPPVPQDG